MFLHSLLIIGTKRKKRELLTNVGLTLQDLRYMQDLTELLQVTLRKARGMYTKRKKKTPMKTITQRGYGQTPVCVNRVELEKTGGTIKDQACDLNKQTWGPCFFFFLFSFTLTCS